MSSDLILLAVALPLVLLALFRGRWRPAAPRFAARVGWCMLALAVLPVALRLALLGRSPAPVPSGADDFSFLLLADTLRHFRLANPVHPLRMFFEAVFIMQEPSYSSIFPLGQGIALALGWMLFGHPWAGVLLPMAAFAGLCYWMLRGWVSPGWALVGGLLAVLEFGPLCQWMNLYWGGGVSAAAGCLVFGAIPRLGSRTMPAPVLLGCGLGLQMLTRPFEGALLALCIAPFLWRQWRRIAIVGVVMLPAVGLMLLHNRAVTGSATTMPYQLSRYQYGIPATFTVQPNPTPHRALTAEQDLDYQAQCIIHGEGTDNLRSYAERWFSRLHFYRFFFYVPLLIALPAFVLAARERRYAWVAGALAVFSLGTNFYPYFYPHYIAAATCLFVLVSVVALERLSCWKPGGAAAAAVIVCLCGAQFLFWYGLHAFAPEDVLFAVGQYETSDYINYGDAEGRIAIERQLAQAPGKQLVFVRYGPKHAFHEWIHNEADIDGARVVWAGDRGPDEDEWLQRYYKDRTAWVVEPDVRSPRLIPYAAPAEPPAPEPEVVAPVKGRKPVLRFDEGPVNNSGGVREMQRKR
jgi:hypothetical protein